MRVIKEPLLGRRCDNCNQSGIRKLSLEYKSIRLCDACLTKLKETLK